MASTHPRFGIVGGGIRGSMFGAAIRQHPDATLVAICDRSDGVRATVSADLDVPAYPDVETMLSEHPDLTAAVIATPDFAHLEPTLACLDRGLDLMIEKPLATTPEDAAAICAAAERTGRRVMVGFENRWNSRFSSVRDELVSGQRGQVVNQVVNLNDTAFVPTRMLSWAAQSSPAWFLMPHALDLATWLSGATPVDVFARGTKQVLPGRGVDTWDAITASFAMSDGSLLVLNSQWVLPETMPAVFDFRYEMHTDSTSYRIDISDTGVARYGTEGLQWLQFGVTEHHGHLRGVPIDMINDFIDGLNGADLDLPGADHGRLITDAIAAVHASLTTGQSIPLSGQSIPLS